MKKISRFLCGMFFLLMTSGLANATLITIGTAQFAGTGTEYNLIWDDDNNGNSVVWLDYTKTPDSWDNQRIWALDLNNTLTYNIDSAYTVEWGGSNWRLPTTVDGPFNRGYDGTTTAGYSITTSEMGHLYYTELGNVGYYDTNGDFQSGWGLINTGDFRNLNYSDSYGWCWSSTESSETPTSAWGFGMGDGGQGYDNKIASHYGLAVRSGQVSADPVPEPSTILLFGIGLVGLVGLNRQRKGSRV